MLVLTALEAPAKRKRRRARKAEDEAPAPVPVTRATLTLGVALADRSQAEHWLKATARDRKARAEARLELYRALELAALAWALASMETVPGIPSPALVERIGFGDGQAVADGSWEQAVELPGPEPGGRPRRPTAPSGMPPILAGREAIEPSTLLALRARGDLARGRNRAAAIGIEAALRSLQGEAQPALDATTRQAVADAAERAAGDEPTAEQVTALRAAIESLRPGR